MLTAWFCISDVDDNTKTPTIVSLIDSFILTHKSKIIGREWEMKWFLSQFINPKNSNNSQFD